MRQSALTIGVALLTVSCTARPKAAVSPVADLASRADAQWMERGATGLDELDVVLLREAAYRDDRSLLWRLARVEVARGLAADKEHVRVEHYGRARDYGLRCLDRTGGFRQKRMQGEWTEALGLLPVSQGKQSERALQQEQCGAWAAVAWARWMGTLGADASALDRVAVLALGRWARDSSRPLVSGLGAWALGVLAATEAKGHAGDAMERALANLKRARDVGVGGLWVDADQLRGIARPLGDDDMIRRLEQRLRNATSPAPEEARAVRIAR